MDEGCRYLADRLMGRVEGSRRAVADLDGAVGRMLEREARFHYGPLVLAFAAAASAALEKAVKKLSPESADEVKAVFTAEMVRSGGLRTAQALDEIIEVEAALEPPPDDFDGALPN